jgi:hypothetical protein
MVCAAISMDWARQPVRRDADASQAAANDAQAIEIAALRVVIGKPRALSPRLADGPARLLALGFPMTTQTIAITQIGS